VVSGMSNMGIFHRAAAGLVTVSDTNVRDNQGDGIRLVTSVGSLTLERVSSDGNTKSGLYISPNMASGDLAATIVDCVFSQNGLHGIWVDTAASSRAFVSVDRSTISDNSPVGIQAQSATSAIVFMTVQRSTLRHNGHGIVAVADGSGGTEVNASDNVLYQNLGSGILVQGSTSYARVSGNNFDHIICQLGGKVFT